VSDEERLTPEEESALRELARGPTPRTEVEDRVVAALRRRGLLGRPRRRFGWRLTVAAAAAVLLFAGGYLVGRRSVAGTGVPTAESVERPERATAEPGLTQVVWF